MALSGADLVHTDSREYAVPGCPNLGRPQLYLRNDQAGQGGGLRSFFVLGFSFRSVSQTFYVCDVLFGSGTWVKVFSKKSHFMEGCNSSGCKETNSNHKGDYFC